MSKSWRKVEKTLIHDVERTRLRQQLIEDIALVHLAVADVDKARDVAPQIKQGMPFDGSLGGSKRCPRKHRQTQIGDGIENVDGLFESYSKRLF